jgi:hypothetical protein
MPIESGDRKSIVPEDFIQPTKGNPSNIQIPKLSKLQIKKIIEENYDTIIDLYLRKKEDQNKDLDMELPNV